MKVCDPWQMWEDWEAGMYVQDAPLPAITASRALLADPDVFRETAREMVRAWPIAAHHNLVNMWTGRRAWIGQASCMYAHAATSAATRQAWGMLTLDEQRAANAVADATLLDWTRDNVGQTLFDH